MPFMVLRKKPPVVAVFDKMVHLLRLAAILENVSPILAAEVTLNMVLIPLVGTRLMEEQFNKLNNHLARENREIGSTEKRVKNLVVSSGGIILTAGFVWSLMEAAAQGNKKDDSLYLMITLSIAATAKLMLEAFAMCYFEDEPGPMQFYFVRRINDSLLTLLASAFCLNKWDDPKLQMVGLIILITLAFNATIIAVPLTMQRIHKFTQDPAARWRDLYTGQLSPERVLALTTLPSVTTEAYSVFQNNRREDLKTALIDQKDDLIIGDEVLGVALQRFSP